MGAARRVRQWTRCSDSNNDAIELGDDAEGTYRATNGLRGLERLLCHTMMVGMDCICG